MLNLIQQYLKPYGPLKASYISSSWGDSSGIISLQLQMHMEAVDDADIFDLNYRVDLYNRQWALRWQICKPPQMVKAAVPSAVGQAKRPFSFCHLRSVFLNLVGNDYQC